MTVSDPRFAAELVTVKGRIYTFDSIECLASYYLANQSTARSLWVTDATTPGILIPAESARYARGGAEAPAGAMGLALRATADGSLSWSDVLALAEHDRLGTSGSKPGPQ